MPEKNLLDDDIIELTDLLEEGSPPKKASSDTERKRTVPEPDSFDLGKELATDIDVSVEEIEQEGLTLSGEETVLFEDTPPKDASGLDTTMEKTPSVDLGGLAGEIDQALQESIHDVTITKNEEAVLLHEAPVEEPPQESPSDAVLETPIEAETHEVLEEIPAPEEIEETPPAASPREPVVSTGGPAVEPVGSESLAGIVADEFRKDVPRILEEMVRPLVQELMREISAATREALPGIVEKVIREEIEKLKKLAV